MNIAGRKKISRVNKIAIAQAWLEASAIIPSESELKVFFEKPKKEPPVTALTPHKEMVAEWAKEGPSLNNLCAVKA